MTSYFSRRTRWWVCIKELDPQFSATETLLVGYLFHCAGISPDQKLMILTRSSNIKTRAVIEVSLRKQHSRLHEHESSHGFSLAGRP